MAQQFMGQVPCGLCGESIPLPMHRASGQGQPLLLQVLDTQPLADHMATCQVAAKGNAPAPAAIAGRVDQMLSVGGFVSTGGSRACTMCGTRGDACLEGVRVSRASCCGVCAEGNTHPSPGEADGSCREWAAEHVGRVQR